jgi:multidrug efflux pump subunit AcrA (membrane-fusion protein)
VLLLFLVAAATRQMKKANAATTLPTTRVRRGEFGVIVRCRGEITARRSVQLSAPVNIPDLKIVWLAPAGAFVKSGEPVVRFDPSSARQQLNEKQAVLEHAQAALDQAIAQARITAEQDRLDLANARYEVERARLEVSKRAIVSVLQGEAGKIDLATAEEKLRLEQATVNLHVKSDESKVASLKQARDSGKAEVDLMRRKLAQMELRSPLNGVATLLMNSTQDWMNRQPYKVGDHAFPGAPIAEIPDLATLEMEGKLEEVDRGSTALGNPVRVHVDAFPEETFVARLGSISPLLQMTLEWPPTRSFRAYGRLEKPDPRLRPGMNGNMDIVVRQIPDAISVPGKAVFLHDGKPVVYLASAEGPRRVEVEVLGRNPDEVAIKGIAADAVVLLASPETGREKK